MVLSSEHVNYKQPIKALGQLHLSFWSAASAHDGAAYSAHDGAGHAGVSCCSSIARNKADT